MEENINILTELREAGSTILLNANRDNLYFISPDYFNNLPRDVMSRIFVESIPRTNPYTVPGGYFDQLSTIILENISAHESISILEGGAEMLYSVPQGYFESFASNVLQKIKGQTSDSVHAELEELSPLLSKIPKTNVYAIPDGYFDALTPLKKEKENTPAKVISFGAKTRSWINYAAAACVAAILLGGAYIYFSKPGSEQIANQPKKGIDIQKGLSELTDSEITDYLNHDNSTAVYTSQGADEQRDLDVNVLLQNMSDEEIEQYLIKNADPGEEKGGI